MVAQQVMERHSAPGMLVIWQMALRELKGWV